MPQNNPMAGLSPAANDLGLGTALSEQVKGETEEERKKRLSLQQQMAAIGPAAMSLGLTGAGVGRGY